MCGSEHFQEVASNMIVVGWTWAPQALCPNSSASRRELLRLHHEGRKLGGAGSGELGPCDDGYIHPLVSKSLVET